jgi:hypothetical protein
MQADVDFVGGPDKLVWQSRPAAGAENYAGLPKGVVNVFVPPTGVPELDDVAPRGIELADEGY